MTASAQASPAVTWQGTKLRAWMAWHCVNRYGCFPPAVWAGSRNCRAELSGEQLKRTPTDSCAATRGMGGRQCSEQVDAVRCTARQCGRYGRGLDAPEGVRSRLLVSCVLHPPAPLTFAPAATPGGKLIWSALPRLCIQNPRATHRVRRRAGAASQQLHMRHRPLAPANSLHVRLPARAAGSAPLLPSRR